MTGLESWSADWACLLTGWMGLLLLWLAGITGWLAWIPGCPGLLVCRLAVWVCWVDSLPGLDYWWAESPGFLPCWACCLDVKACGVSGIAGGLA
jgi:hypothetical protein